MENGKFERKESFKHKLAKGLLREWVNKGEKTRAIEEVIFRTPNGKWDPHNLSDLYSLFEFYEKYVAEGLPSKKKELLSKSPYFYSEVHEMIASNPGPILFVPDITVFYKGSITEIYEIVHTNPVCRKKLELMQTYFEEHFCSAVEAYEVQAEGILRLTEPPLLVPFLDIRRQPWVKRLFWDISRQPWVKRLF